MLRSMFPIILALAALSGIAVVACTDTTTRAGTVVVRHSAGVSIVENTAPASELAVWTLVGQPELQLRAVEGDSAEQFFRVSGAVRLSDGRIAVANAGSQELRLFAPDGRRADADCVTRRGHVVGPTKVKSCSGSPVVEFPLPAGATDRSVVRTQHIILGPAP